MKKKPVVIILLFLLFWNKSPAQALRVQAITVADGLSQGFVSCLFQDSRGFIWIGTFNGLNRYDGYQIKRYDLDNTQPWSLKANFIHCITEDRHGLLWLGTDKGPIVHDPYSDRFVHLAEAVPALSGAYVNQIITCSDGRVWICNQQPGTSGVLAVQPPDDLAGLIRAGRLNGRAFQVQPISLGAGLHSPLTGLQMLQDSILIAADTQNRHCRINPATYTAERSNPRTLPHRRYGNYRLLYQINGKQGFVFLPGDLPQNQSENIKDLSEFVQMPGGEILLLRIGTKVLHRMDTLASRRLAPGFERLSFYRQFPSFFELDVLPTQAAIIDRSGNLWVGTSGFGVRKISRGKLDFNQYLPQYSFYNFRFLPNGRVWPGTDFPHHVSNLQTGRLEPAPWVATLSNTYFPYSILITKSGDWWVAALKQGQLILLKKDHTTNRWTEWPVSLHWLRDVPVQLLEDSRGAVWLAGHNGNIVRIRSKDNLTDTWNISPYFPKNQTDQLRSTALVEDPAGNLWIGSNFGLVQVKSPEAEPTFRIWQNDDNNPALFKTEWILNVYPDPKTLDAVWIGLRGGGLARFDARTQTIKHFTTKEGLVNDVVYGILPDSFGYLWLSTNQGLSRFDPNKQTFYNYNKVEPAINTEFNTGGYGYTPAGDLAFGGIEGLFVVRPNDAPQNSSPLAVLVTDIAVNGQNIDFSHSDVSLRINPDNTLNLLLEHDRNNLVIAFTAPAAADPAIVQYRYRLLPLAKDWVSTGFQHTANFVGIPPGQYTLELQAKNSNDDWGGTPASYLQLCIQPPWYRTIWAYLFYASAVLLIFRLYVRTVRKRLALEHAVDLSRREMEQLKTLDDFKNRFFAYISHEFKTPLTIILGLAERLGREKKPAQTAGYPKDIIRQGQYMLELVDQMVDIARLDERHLRLQWRQGNISQYVRYLVESHRPLADFRQIQLQYASEAPELMMDFDPLRLKYMLTNLLTNAIRHTRSGGMVGVHIALAGETGVRLEVSDTGEGIAPEDLPHIFERYFRGKSGGQQDSHFGLGLAFVKDLVELFKGAISVSSTPGLGTTFSITLPVSREAPLLESLPAIQDTPVQSTGLYAGEHPHDSPPLLLVVEDNPVIAAYLQTCLNKHFRLLFATDGDKGWEMALEQIPDLILTDVMLPGIDGVELTRRIKTHELTSHIPVVILSARSELGDRLSGQRQGADAYLAKPFNEQELILVLQNLHGLQRRRHERYASLKMPAGAAPSADTIPAEDDEAIWQTDAFLLKLYDVFEKNYTSDAYGLPHLCRDLEISKSQLQRKLAVLSDQPAIELLRRFRLQKARDLLSQHPERNVREICFQVGFKDPAHFSRMFSKTFGLAPSEIKNKKSPEE